MKPIVRPRQRFYGGSGSYGAVLAAAVSGGLRRGDDVEKFEAALARKLGRRFAVATPQDRVGIYLLLKRLPADRREVILSPYTIHDVVNMVICAGCEPVFADVEADTGNISAAATERLMSRRTGAVLVTHLHGVGCDIAPIAALCRERDIRLYEDCAQSLGAKFRGAPLGSIGDAGIFSFGMAKNINSLFGGAIVTEDESLSRELRSEISEWPWFPTERLVKRALYLALSDVILRAPVFPLLTYPVFRYGYLNNVDAITNRLRGEDFPTVKTSLPDSYRSRYTPAQARSALPQLSGLDEAASERLTYVEIYREGLRGLPELRQPRQRPDHQDVFLVYPVQPPDRDDFVRFMMAAGVDMTVSHYHNCAEVDAFAHYRGECPVASEVARRMTYLPCYPGYGAANARRVVELAKAYFTGASIAQTAPNS